MRDSIQARADSLALVAADSAATAPAVTDSAGVVALFNAIDRVADATGTSLEDAKAEATADFRAPLGIDAFPSLSGLP